MTSLVDELSGYLEAVEREQAALAGIQTRKGKALRTADAPALLALAEHESTLVRQLRTRLGQREALLIRAREHGHPVGTITDLVQRVGGDRADLRDRLLRTKSTTERLQRETWSHWIIARRTVGQYDEILERIAHQGRQAPTYSPLAPTSGETSGGAVLDASA